MSVRYTQVFCKGERVPARHVSGSWWKCLCGESLNLLEPSYFLITREQELERLIETQNDELPLLAGKVVHAEIYDKLVY
jgi:hypothetical protein